MLVWPVPLAPSAPLVWRAQLVLRGQRGTLEPQVLADPKATWVPRVLLAPKG